MNKKMTISATILTIAAIGQIMSAFVFYNPEGNAIRINTGWVILWLSAIFGWLPILTFRKKGEVKGRNYMLTTKLVTSGIYGIVRHPQYLAGILLNIAFSLITFHWAVWSLGAIAAVTTYLGTYDEEKNCVEKFGEEYLRYQEMVPRVNFIFGILRAISRKSSGN